MYNVSIDQHTVDEDRVVVVAGNHIVCARSLPGQPGKVVDHVGERCQPTACSETFTQPPW